MHHFEEYRLPWYEYVVYLGFTKLETQSMILDESPHIHTTPHHTIPYHNTPHTLGIEPRALCMV
jgi:hypothetical protein